jgi:hypothetical protein
LTKNGDCVIGVSADKAVADLSEPLKLSLMRAAKVEITIVVSGLNFHVEARGHPGLTLDDPNDLVIRRSSFVSGRTLAICANRSAAEVPRSMIERLKDPNARGTLIIEVTEP